MLNEFNNEEPRLQFTMEIGKNKINFLDITLTNENSTLITNWYRKPTWSGRYLNFQSHTHKKYKISTINNLVDRATKLAHPKFHLENLKIITDTLDTE